MVRAMTLEAKARALLGVIDEARDLEGRIAGLMAKLRSTSRVPALVELLTGFGAMRSSQIEVLLDVTRLGARKILDTLNKSGALSRSKLGGVRLFEIMTAQPFTTPVSPEPQLEDAPSSAAREHDETMVDVDDVLERYGIEIPEDDE